MCCHFWRRLLIYLPPRTGLESERVIYQWSQYNKLSFSVAATITNPESRYLFVCLCVCCCCCLFLLFCKGDSRVSKPLCLETYLKVLQRGGTNSFLTAFRRLWRALYFDFIAIHTVYIHGLGTTVSISSSQSKHSKSWVNLSTLNCWD